MKSNMNRKMELLALLILQSAARIFGMGMASDIAAKALDQGDLKTAYQAILFVEEGSKIAPLFYQESIQANSDPVLRVRLDKVAAAFDRRLRKEMNSMTFAAYRQFAADENLNEQDRMRLLIPMVGGISTLSSPQKDSLKAFLKELLASGTSTTMKASLLIQATRMPSIGLDASALIPFCRSNDTTLRKAAFHGLISTIRHNRDLGKSALNQAVFDSVKVGGSQALDAYRVLALASIGEDYARDYLLSKCAWDAGQLVSIIRHDPYLTHPGLVLAALKFPGDTPEGIATRDALRYGLKEPAWVANQIESGAYSNPAKADELRKVMAIQTTVSR